MERTVPSTASEEVELYLRTYYSLLRSTTEVQIRTLEEAHAGMHSLLHPDVRKTRPDINAFVYCILRMPECLSDVNLVVLGQSANVFRRAGYLIDNSWLQVSAPARRRRCFYNGSDTLACIIASRSDIDDIIPILTAYQIEWNKIHYLMQKAVPVLEEIESDDSGWEKLAMVLEITAEDMSQLISVLGESPHTFLQKIASTKRQIEVRLISGSLSEYRRAAHAWWERIEQACPDLTNRPVYFVSSNTHSLVNVLSGFAIKQRELLIEYAQEPDNAPLALELADIMSQEVPSSLENFLYYALKKYQQSRTEADFDNELREFEETIGVRRVPGEDYFDVEAQVVELAKLDYANIDPRVPVTGAEIFRKSDAVILNIDYPLGLAAYNILNEITDHVFPILGVYIMGKAATLNAVVGDVMISNVVHDEQSKNTYLFPNCFHAADISPHLIYGSVLDNQKAVSVRGTFLQNESFMDVFYREGYTNIEMEAGPYLSAIYEMYRPKRHPIDEIVNLYELPFDLGIVHYASDTPLSRGKNLGAGSLSYYGMDSAYATTLAITKRIFQLERARLS